jgi:hypothetical protein
MVSVYNSNFLITVYPEIIESFIKPLKLLYKTKPRCNYSSSIPIQYPFILTYDSNLLENEPFLLPGYNSFDGICPEIENLNINALVI